MAEVQLVEYDARWPGQFQAFRASILRAIPGARVEHFGSTSVPGCAAKPIIDISVGLPLGTSVREQEFRSAGLRFRSIQPYSIVFAIDHSDGSRAANVHVRYIDSEAELRDLRFRDYLRTHPDAVRAYTEAKRRALVASPEREDYNRAKAPFIERLRREVDSRAEGIQWSPGGTGGSVRPDRESGDSRKRRVPGQHRLPVAERDPGD
jgi:GrpB-like predicted nucleotidyltransferase (UPF0157 family)